MSGSAFRSGRLTEIVVIAIAALAPLPVSAQQPAPPHEAQATPPTQSAPPPSAPSSGAQPQQTSSGASPSAESPSSGTQKTVSDCPVQRDQLLKALKESVHASGGPDNGGLPVNEWAAVVDRQGTVCAVVFSGKSPTAQWPGSRGIAVEKANTVNAFGLDTYAVSTANLWAPAQPGGSLYGAANSNPVSVPELYAGNPTQYGSASDPLLGKRPGGVMVFGGGLALYKGKSIVGGLGASGNTSCADHNIAWRVREKLGLDKVPNGPSPHHNDEIVYDVGPNGKSASGWGHPECGHTAPQVAEKIGSGMVEVAQKVGQLPADASHAAQSGGSKAQNTLPSWQR